MKQKTIHYYIGIDPGATTGMAVCANLNIRTVESGSFWDIHVMLTRDGGIIETLIRDGHKITAVIENPNLNKTTFRRTGDMRTDDRKAQNVGMNKRDAQLWIDLFERMGVEVIRVKPVQRKLDRKDFDRLTRYNKQTNQHERDAVMLVYGR